MNMTILLLVISVVALPLGIALLFFYLLVNIKAQAYARAEKSILEKESELKSLREKDIKLHIDKQKNY